MIAVEFTTTELEAEVRKLAAEHPDNIYTKPNAQGAGCFYGKGTCTDGSCGCIVGQALARLGVSVLELDVKLIGYVPEVMSHLCISDPKKRQSWLFNVQRRQDLGKTWGEAVEWADNYTLLPIH